MAGVILYGIVGNPCQPKSCTKKAFCHPDFSANVNFGDATWVAVEFDTVPSNVVSEAAEYDRDTNGGSVEGDISTYFTFDTVIEVSASPLDACGANSWKASEAILLGGSTGRRKLDDTPAPTTLEPATAPTISPTVVPTTATPTIASKTGSPTTLSTTSLPTTTLTAKKTSAPTTVAGADTPVPSSVPSGTGTVAADAPTAVPSSVPRGAGTATPTTTPVTYTGNFILCNSNVKGDFYVLTDDGSGQYTCQGKGRCSNIPVRIVDQITGVISLEDPVEVYEVTGLGNYVIWGQF
jgi:hypothetical protein